MKLKKKIIIIAIAAIVIMIPVYFLFIDGGSSDITSEEKQLYTCGMHPEIISDEPGLCPICEMNLTPIKSNTQISMEIIM